MEQGRCKYTYNGLDTETTKQQAGERGQQGQETNKKGKGWKATEARVTCSAEEGGKELGRRFGPESRGRRRTGESGLAKEGKSDCRSQSSNSSGGWWVVGNWSSTMGLGTYDAGVPRCIQV